jgi:hypothetical protein
MYTTIENVEIFVEDSPLGTQLSFAGRWQFRALPFSFHMLFEVRLTEASRD